MTEASHDLVWRQLHWPGKLDPQRVVACLRAWAADGRSPRLVLEARATREGVRYLLATPSAALPSIGTPLRTGLGARLLPSGVERRPVVTAGRLSASTRHRPLRADDAEAVVRAMLGALVRVTATNSWCCRSCSARGACRWPSRTQSPSSVVAPWWQVAWHGNGGQVDSEKRAALRTKVGRPRLRLHRPARRHRRNGRAAAAALLLGLLAAIRTSEAAGVQLRLVPEQRRSGSNAARRPGAGRCGSASTNWPALTAWPLGSDDLPGQPAAHPKRLPPAPGTTGAERVVGDGAAAPAVDGHAGAAGYGRRCITCTSSGRPAPASRRCSANLIAAGHRRRPGRGGHRAEGRPGRRRPGAQVPESAADDVVVLDPQRRSAGRPEPAGRPRPAAGAGRPTAVLAVFKQLYGDACGTAHPGHPATPAC